jgi:hypothetical protein
LNNKYKVVPYFDQGWFARDERDVVEFFTNSAGSKPGEDQYRHYYSVQEVLDDKPSELNCYLYEITVKIKPS